MSPRDTSRSGARSRVRVVLGLVLVGLLAFPLIAASNRVEVKVDGDVVALRTYADTVADVLDDLEVELRHGDEVSHDLDAPLEEGMEITIARAVTVDILVDGLVSHRVVAPVTSVAGALTEAGMEDVRDNGADIVPPWTALIEDGAVIEVWTPQEITVEVDGDQIELASLVSDVDTFLSEQGIELGDDDIVSVALETPLVFVNEVVIERVEFIEEVEEVVLEHETERREFGPVALSISLWRAATAATAAGNGWTTTTATATGHGWTTPAATAGHDRSDGRDFAREKEKAVG